MTWLIMNVAVILKQPWLSHSFVNGSFWYDIMHIMAANHCRHLLEHRNANLIWRYAFLAHLSLKAHWWAYSIAMVHCPSSVRPPFSKIFFSETTWPIKAKFHVEPPWVGGMKVCSRGLGHMTKMAATPTYSKNPLNIFFSRTKGPMTLWLGM